MAESATPRRWLGSVLQRAGEPVDGASMAVFRMLFGLIMAVAVVRFFAYGWIDEQYVLPRFFFSYEGFSWVKPWPAWGMHVHFGLIGVLAALVMVGWRTRWTLGMFFVAFTYVELLDKTNYLNHYVLVSLLAALMFFMPVGNTWGLDASRASTGEVPRWCVWALRVQVGLVYFFAGVAKLRADWLLHAEPLSTWFLARTDMPLIGGLLGLHETALFASWFGAVFDLSFPFLMSWRRARPYAFAVGVVFHLVTGLLFQIGLFPWIMVGAGTLFFAPDWPPSLLGRVIGRTPTASDQSASPGRLAPALPSWAAILLVGVFVVQMALPFRKHLHQGDVAWTEAGFRFSWHVMLAEKAGVVWFEVHDVDTGERFEVHPQRYLAPRQHKMMSTSPDMIVQFAHHIADDFRQRGHQHVEVRAEAYVALNGRRSAPLFDPRADLLAVELAPNPLRSEPLAVLSQTRP